MAIEHAEPGWVLHEADLVAHRLVDIEHEARLVDVEVPRSLDVADRHSDQFEFEVHGSKLSTCTDTAGPADTRT
jgi:hypothetical protein